MKIVSIAVAYVLVLSQVDGLAFEGLAALASADTPAETDRTIRDFLDLNDDHRISYDEFVHSMAVKAMREMDTDRDGLLSPSEAASASAKGHAGIPPIDFSKADANGDDRGGRRS